ncbi:caspase family protein [Pseudomonas sp. Irchel 3E13]|uniref:caspase family protein n=1 Tax=Pseudomonas sp. Irchel 3E13 TaxID=2008975 RepID=UPI001179BB9D|nr:caspase family protein [Pseudomonas sp. Irchel 3E13]
MATFIHACKPVGHFLGAISLFMLGGTHLAAAQYPPAPDLASLPAWAQEKAAPVKRAFVVGIGDYRYAKPEHLDTPQHDAELVSKALRQLDPNVSIMLLTQHAGDQQPASDLARTPLLKQFKIFKDSLQPGDIAILYFSGHGIEVDGLNYLVPADAEPSPAGDETSRYISLSYLIREIQQTRAGLTVIVLDACRSSPFSSTAVREEPLRLTDAVPPAAIEAIVPNQYMASGARQNLQPKGFLIFFAAQAGQVSFSLTDRDDPRDGSIFTRSLLRLLTTENQPAFEVFGMTSGVVSRMTNFRQNPLIASYNAGRVMFMDNHNLANDELEVWVRTVSNKSDDQLIGALSAFIDRYPTGIFTTAARARLSFLEPPRFPIEDFQFERHGIVQQKIDIGVLGGALRVPELRGRINTTAIAQYDVNVRNIPTKSNSKVLASIKQGQRVAVLEDKAAEGWTQVMLEDGTTGYVGSVRPQTMSAESIKLKDRDFPTPSDLAVIDRWGDKLGRGRSTIEINVGVFSGENATEAAQAALLHGLRLRALIEAQGVSPSNLVMRLDSPDVPPDVVSISLMTENSR